MSLSLKRIFAVLAAISLIYVPGCQEAYAGIERAEDASAYRLAASDSELTLSLGECGDAVDAEAGENEAAPFFWTKAVVTIGGVRGGACSRVPLSSRSMANHGDPGSKPSAAASSGSTPWSWTRITAGWWRRAT
jgi:hypothetical protein